MSEIVRRRIGILFLLTFWTLFLAASIHRVWSGLATVSMDTRLTGIGTIALAPLVLAIYARRLKATLR